MHLLRRTFKIAAKAFLIALGVTISLLISEIAVEMFFPAGFQTPSVRRAHAFLFNNSEFHELPDKVEITIDGIKRTFIRGTDSYEKIKHLLQNGRSDALFEKAGAQPQFPGVAHAFGEMTISTYGLPSHFRIIHSNNFYWIGLPKLTSPGTTYPIFTVDPTVIAFLRHNTGAQQGAAANP